MDLSRLENKPLAPPPGFNNSARPSWQWASRRFQRLQLDHLTNWVSRQIHPVENMPAYGADIAMATGDFAARMLLNDTAQAVGQQGSPAQLALYGYVQMGLDIWGIMENNGSWPANGGHDEGRKLPLSWTAVVLGDEHMQQAVAGVDPIRFQESSEIRVHPEHEHTTPLWGASTTADEDYWKVVVTGDGERIEGDPYGWIDGGAFPGSFYQYCCNSQTWKMAGLVQQQSAPVLQTFNFTPMIDYVVRWNSIGTWAQPDPCAPPTGTCSDGSGKCTGYINKPCGQGGKGKCQLSMDGYKTEFGPDGKGGCILDKDPSDGTGRFPSMHAQDTNQGDYVSPFAMEMYKLYGKQHA